MISLFYFSLIVIFYILIGYPLLIILMARLKPMVANKGDYLPSVSILLPVYNEEEKVEKRIRNLSSLSYPTQKMEILIGSDGSSDNTNKELGKVKNKIVSIYTLPHRKGKPSVLNTLAKEAKGEILIFADCRQEWKKDSLRELVRNFADEKVGVVSGLVYEEENDFYRRYENFIRSKESKFASVPGATGAMYALRANLFKSIPADTILDDFVIPMQAVKQGYYSIVEPLANAKDISFTLSEEKRRKMRTLAGNFQAFFRYRWLFNPFKNPIWFQTFSHKFLRLTAPLFLFLLFISNIFIYRVGIFYKITLLLQVLFYLCGYYGKIRFKTDTRNGHQGKAERVFYILATFLELNWATVLGFLKFLTGEAKVTWHKGEQ